MFASAASLLATLGVRYWVWGCSSLKVSAFNHFFLKRRNAFSNGSSFFTITFTNFVFSITLNIDAVSCFLTDDAAGG